MQGCKYHLLDAAIILTKDLVEWMIECAAFLSRLLCTTPLPRPRVVVVAIVKYQTTDEVLRSIQRNNTDKV